MQKTDGASSTSGYPPPEGAAATGPSVEQAGEGVNWSPVVIFALIGVVLTFLAIANYLWVHLNTFWAELMLHLGAGTLVAAVFVVVGEDIKKHVNRNHRELQENRQALQDLSQQTNRQLSKLDEHLRDRLNKELALDTVRAERFGEHGDYASLDTLLHRAEVVDSISRVGVRVAISGTDLYLRICPHRPDPGEADRASLAFSVESIDRAVRSVFTWKKSEDPTVFIDLLREKLSRLGVASAPEKFVETVKELRFDLAETLQLSADSRMGAMDLYPVGPIFHRLSRDWYITSTGMDNIRTGYRIPVEDVRKGTCWPDEESINRLDWASMLSCAQRIWRPDRSIEPFW